MEENIGRQQPEMQIQAGISRTVSWCLVRARVSEKKWREKKNKIKIQQGVRKKMASCSPVDWVVPVLRRQSWKISVHVRGGGI